jgi:hypothetical protein
LLLMIVLLLLVILLVLVLLICGRCRKMTYASFMEWGPR